jgi:cell division protein FtsZ
MTGGEPHATPTRTQPPATPGYRSRLARDEDAEMSPEQERIEIPAFLRRQAN